MCSECVVSVGGGVVINLILFCGIVGWCKECFGNENERVAQCVLVHFSEEASLEFGSLPGQFWKTFTDFNVLAMQKELIKWAVFHFAISPMSLGGTWYFRRGLEVLGRRSSPMRWSTWVEVHGFWQNLKLSFFDHFGAFNVWFLLQLLFFGYLKALFQLYYT